MPRRVAAICAALALALPLVAAPGASAHAVLLTAAPAPGARLPQSPRLVRLDFTSRLNSALSTASVLDTRTGRPVAAAAAVTGRTIELRPRAPLARAAYSVVWRTVSTDDGHELQGSFGFGVGAAASHGTAVAQSSADSWRSVLRAVFYAALLFFCGGVAGELLRPRGGWLVPRELRDGNKPGSPVAAAAFRRTRNAGAAAAGLAAAVALADAAAAAGGVSLHGVQSYLLSNAAGLGRVATAVALAVAAAAVTRSARVSAAAAAAALLAIAVSGHASSAHPRAVALAADWLHLVAAAVWAGGIAQIAITWIPRVRASARLRLAVMRDVLTPFGRIALPAFGLLVAAGLVNALVEVGRPDALWRTAYGRTLSVKVLLVAATAAASCVHALRLRPRVLRGGAGERSHWRLLGVEPVLATGVVAATALLVAVPLPPRQAAAPPPARAEAGAPAPGGAQLAVAGELGPDVASVTIDRRGHGRLRLLGLNLAPDKAVPRIAGARASACGAGCWSFTLPAGATRISLSARGYAVSLPARWLPDASYARQLLDRAQAAMRDLASVRVDETIASGPATPVVTRYRLEAPDRFAYATSTGSADIVVGQSEWFRAARGGAWRRDVYGGGPPAFSTRSWFDWTTYARSVELLRVGGRVAEIALSDPSQPVWFRLAIDRASGRVVSERMIADAHFMTRRYYAFNRPLSVVPPS